MLYLLLSSCMICLHSWLFNRALDHVVVPTTFKAVYITTLLKKSDLHSDDVKSYRPISNLLVLSKSVSLLDGLLTILQRSSTFSATAARTKCSSYPACAAAFPLSNRVTSLTAPARGSLRNLPSADPPNWKMVTWCFSECHFAEW